MPPKKTKEVPVEEQTCPIQECKITLSNTFVECPFCKFKACIKCYKYIALNSTTVDCMNCKKVWNDDFIDTILPKSLRKNDLKSHQENIMFERQEALFGETMLLVSRKKKVEKIQEKINKLKLKIERYNREIYEINHPGVYRPDPLKKEEEKKKVLIIKKCPETDCQGYLDSDYTCGICETVLCPKCEVIKEDDEHECKKDDIETVKLKNNTSKPCPTCSKLTFKDGGCSQVWCPPPCNGGTGTAWNFNTGQIEKGMVHSPDYYDYMRRNNNGIVPRQENVTVCVRRDEIPPIWDLQRRLELVDYLKLTEIHRFFVDLRGNIMYKFREIEQPVFNRNLDLRMLYLNNDIDKDKFKKTLFARNKKSNKNKTIYQNLDMLYNVGVDIFNQLKFQPIINKKTTLIETDGVYESLENIRNYYNSIISKTKERYDCKGLCVSELKPTWKFSH